MSHIWSFRFTTTRGTSFGFYYQRPQGLQKMTNLDYICKSKMGNNLKAQTERLRLSRSIKSWNACCVYLFMYFYGFWKNILWPQWIADTICHVLQKCYMCQRTNSYCTAEENVCGNKTLKKRGFLSHKMQHFILFWLSTMHCKRYIILTQALLSHYLDVLDI